MEKLPDVTSETG